MKSRKILILITLITGFFSSCKEDRDYLLGLPEYDHHYYIGFVPYNNNLLPTTTVSRSQTALLKIPVSFHSSFVRDYDAVAQYKLKDTIFKAGTPPVAVTTPAMLGTDFNIVDKNGAVIQPVDGKYSIVFPKAQRARDTIYVKLLNNTAAPGPRSIAIDLIENITADYRVDTMLQGYRRPLRIN